MRENFSTMNNVFNDSLDPFWALQMMEQVTHQTGGDDNSSENNTISKLFLLNIILQLQILIIKWEIIFSSENS